eukprot:TRINITY_DN8670_c0_g1_i2.p1 TRINITY_DN8670_c0_g1~~TRINITY_DN8670_c0_g1_i2.p1  ORF type:complete len:254 (-),score=22.56 TRINITY_DN8670_c0_g1_i2:387-1148(-)
MSVFLSEVDSSCPFVPSLNGPKGPPPVYVDDWQEFYDKKQQHAYFNSKSRGQSLWVRPTQDDITKELKAATDILNQQNGEQSTINDEWRGKYISLLDELIDYLDSSIQSQSQSVEEQTRSVSGISINGGEVKENVQSFEGFLTKQGGGTSFFGRKSYKRRYFLLENGVLSYWKSESERVLGRPPIKGSNIELWKYLFKPDENNRLGFYLDPKQPMGRRWHLVCLSADDFLMWTCHLSKHIHYFSKLFGVPQSN